jgi:hypothetical protein
VLVAPALALDATSIVSGVPRTVMVWPAVCVRRTLRR